MSVSKDSAHKCPYCGAKLVFLGDYGKNVLEYTGKKVRVVWKPESETYSCRCTAELFIFQNGVLLKRIGG